MAELFTSPPKPEEGKAPDPDEPVWTYRGYRLKTSEFVTAMVHFFRAEIQRANVWRQRLDATTNWAVVSTGATLSGSGPVNAGRMQSKRSGPSWPFHRCPGARHGHIDTVNNPEEE